MLVALRWLHLETCLNTWLAVKINQYAFVNQVIVVVYSCGFDYKRGKHELELESGNKKKW